MYKRNQIESALLSVVMLSSSIFLLASTILSLFPQLEASAGLQAITMPGKFLLQSFSILAFYPIMYLAYNGTLIGLGKDTSVGFFISSFLFLPMLSLSILLRLVFDNNFVYSLVGSWMVELFSISGAITISAVTSLILMLFLYHISSVVQQESEEEEPEQPQGEYPLLPQATVSEENILKQEQSFSNEEPHRNRSRAHRSQSKSQFTPSEGVETLLNAKKMSDFKPHPLEEEYKASEILESKQEIEQAPVQRERTEILESKQEIEQAPVQRERTETLESKQEIEQAPVQRERTETLESKQEIEQVPVQRERTETLESKQEIEQAPVQRERTETLENKQEIEQAQSFIDMDPEDYIPMDPESDSSESNNNYDNNSENSEDSELRSSYKESKYIHDDPDVDLTEAINDALQGNFNPDSYDNFFVSSHSNASTEDIPTATREIAQETFVDTNQNPQFKNNSPIEYSIIVQKKQFNNTPLNYNKNDQEDSYSIPIEGILKIQDKEAYWTIDSDTQKKAEMLQNTLKEFGIEAEITGIRKGPVITMFEILPASGVKLNRIVNLVDNIALSLAAESVRIIAPVPGKHAVGIEIPNRKRHLVSFSEILLEENFPADSQALPVTLGKDITGESQVIDLAKTPHILIAGATGAGKSVCVNSFIASLLYNRSPANVKMILIDPKIVELKLYNDIPHLLTPVITDHKRAFQALKWCLSEMERRYTLLDSMGVRDIINYNRKVSDIAEETARELHAKSGVEKLPYIVVVIDEFADLMANSGKELEASLTRLAAMSRAVGIHLVLATQRPSTDVITGLIKANIPSRIAFMVASKVDSRIIIDSIGAEKLLGRGDMLFSSAWHPFPIRIQGTFLSEDEVENIVRYVKTTGSPQYIDEEMFFETEDEYSESESSDDPLMSSAIDIVMSTKKASASYLQRRLSIGYNRAARLIEGMEDMGILGPQNGSKPREIIAHSQ